MDINENEFQCVYWRLAGNIDFKDTNKGSAISRDKQQGQDTVEKHEQTL